MSTMLKLGAFSMLAAVILMILGRMWAVLLLLVGFCLIVFGWAQMYRGAGYREDAGTINGLYGQGRQQSEAQVDKKAPQSYEDKSPAIWDQMERK